MPKLCPLLTMTDNVFVNPLTVSYVRAGPPGHTFVVFTNDQTLETSIPVQDVVQALNIAMSAGVAG